MSAILMPLPDEGFDVTEVAVPWYVLSRAGHSVVFATASGGGAPRADGNLLKDGWFFGPLSAHPEPRKLYAALVEDAAFAAPLAWRDVDPAAYDGLVLAGGHAPGMRQYLGDATLHAKVAAFWDLGRPVGAICHGTVVLARARRGIEQGGKSVLDGRTTTCLPKYMERISFLLTFWRLGRHYRTYPEYVQDEVTRALGPDGKFVRGPFVLTRRGTADDDTHAMCVEDGNYVSARWPGDAYLFARKFLARVEAAKGRDARAGGDGVAPVG